MGFILGLFLAFFVPLIFLRVIHKYDLYQTGQFKLILLSLGWGVFAYVLASITNLSLEYFEAAARNNIVRYYAPIHEEIFKGLILFIMIKRHRFTYSVDGALYGFATGIGFAIFENFGYINSNPSEALEIAAQRILSANLIHATSSAAIGIAIGMFLLETSWSRWLFFIAGPLVAIGQHMLFNNLISNEVAPVITFIPGFLGLAFIYIAMRHGKKQAQRWIRQKLGMDVRVTRGEVVAVDRLASTDGVLLPVLERFGAKKASQVEKLLYLQAHLGIKRMALDSFQNSNSLHKAIEAEINETRTEMETVRRAIGAYAMLFVRGLFTDEMVSVWDRMQAKIRERSAMRDVQKGGGLWSSLEERVKAPSNTKRL